ncbi:MAG TPA: hypothetical protein VFO38_04985 [Candidatus Saccharimonadales bacterium]|nr:hypothetical protein [Candidatus Saccharimonadales bacterium]
MKNTVIFRLVAMLFVLITAVLLILMVLDIISGPSAREIIMKLAAVSGIIAAAALAMSFLGNSKP